MLACRWGCGFGEGMHFGDEIVVLALEVDDVAVYLAMGLGGGASYGVWCWCFEASGWGRVGWFS